MLTLSDLLIAHKEIETFPDLEELVRESARNGEMHFRINVKPPYFDTPDDWEDRLEAAFSGRV